MAQAVLNIHTPSSSFAIVHSLTQENLFDLYNKLSRKPNTDYYGEQVGPEWLKYEYNDSVWNLDDDSDYTIFGWRQLEVKQLEEQSLRSDDEALPVASSSKTPLPPRTSGAHQPAGAKLKSTPTLHLHNPKKALPVPPEYCNPSYYVFHARAKAPSHQGRASSRAGSNKINGHHSPGTSSQASTTGKRSKKGKGGVVVGLEDDSEGDNTVPRFQKQFNRFHAENGVRTVTGSIGPVQNVRMLLKAGYRNVYISRKFAVKHEFIPADAAPGNYGYGGLVNIGSWPITLVPSASQPNKPAAGYLKPDAFTMNHNHDNQHRRSGSTSTSPTPSGGSYRREQSMSPIPPSVLSGTQRPKSTTNGSVRRTKRNTTPSHQNGISPSTSQQQHTVSVSVPVYLSEEPHFDVVLGRSFFEKRQVKLSTVDPTDVVCLDTGEKIECELVVLKDGRGEIVTIT